MDCKLSSLDWQPGIVKGFKSSGIAHFVPSVVTLQNLQSDVQNANELKGQNRTDHIKLHYNLTVIIEDNDDEEMINLQISSLCALFSLFVPDSKDDHCIRCFFFFHCYITFYIHGTILFQCYITYMSHGIIFFRC